MQLTKMDKNHSIFFNFFSKSSLQTIIEWLILHQQNDNYITITIHNNYKDTIIRRTKIQRK